MSKKFISYISVITALIIIASVSFAAEKAIELKPALSNQTKFVSEKVKIPTSILAKSLSTQDVVVLVQTIQQIGKQDSGSRYVLNEFDRLLAHNNPGVRSEVLDAVFSFDVVKPLLPALAKCLNDPVEDIRENAADIIGDIESRDMISVFISGLTNQYPDVRDNAEFYLLFWTDEDFTNNTAWITWWNKNKKSFVFE